MTKSLKSRKKLKVLMGTLVLTGVIALVWHLTSKPVKAGWYDKGWQYRVKIIINNSGSADTNKKINLTIDTGTLITAGKMQSSCQDSRFTDEQGKLVQYYIASGCNTSTTQYWILLPTINAGATVVYHYYGNPSATAGTVGSQFAQSTFSPSSTSAASEEDSVGPVGYWKFDEGADNTCVGGANDACNSGSEGSAGDAVFAAGANAPTWALGKFGKAISISNSNEFAAVSDNSWYQFGTGNFSVSAWVYPRTVNYGPSAEGAIISKDYTGFEMAIYQGALVIDIGGASNQCASGVVFNTNQWYHVAFIRSGSTVTGYVNGLAVCTATNSASASNSGTAIYIGVRPGGASSYFDGLIDELKIYNYGLTTNQLKVDYNEGSATKLADNNIGQNSVTGAGTPPLDYWNFDEKTGQTAYDRGSGAKNITLGSSGSVESTDPVWVTGKYGSALQYNGSQQSQTGSVVSTATTNVTMEAWIYPTSASQTAVIYYNGNTGSNGYGFFMNNGSGSTGNKITALIGGISNDVTSSTITVVPNTWYHVALTRDSTTWKLYLNGNLNSTATTSPTTPSSATSVGANSFGGNNFSGIVDEVKFYNYARTLDQIAFDYNKNSLPNSYWKFDESQGTTAYDSGFSGNNGTLTGSPTWESGSNCKFNSCLQFNGSSQYITMSNPANGSLNFGTSSFSISTWVYPTANNGLIWDKGANSGLSAGSRSGYYLYLDSSSKLKSEVTSYDADSNFSDFTTTNALPLNTWSHITVVYTAASAIDIYVNGTKQIGTYTNNNVTSITSISTNTSFLVGAYTNTSPAISNYFTGSIDEVKVYSYALSPTQIAQDYNRGATLVLGSQDTGSNLSDGVGTAPIDYWNFDEKTGTTVDDFGTNGYNGTITGTPSWTTGKYGSGLSFDGNAGYVRISQPASQSYPITVEGWSKPKSGGDSIVYSSDNSGGVAIIYTNSSNLYTFDIHTVSNGFSSTNASFTSAPDQWHFVVWQYDGTTLKGYVDGQLAVNVSKTSAINYGGLSDYTLGAYCAGAPCGSPTYATGAIDDIKVYNYIRTTAQMAFDYNRGAPIAWYKFDECQGPTAYDSSPNSNGGFNGNNATLVPGSGAYTSAGSCNSGSSSEMWNAGTTGKFNGSLGFDGTDDYVDAGTASSLNISSDLTLSSWFKTSDNGNTIVLLSKGTTNDWLYDIYKTTDNKLYCKIYQNNSGNSYLIANTPSTVNDNSWHQVSCSVSGTTISLFLDGTLVASNSTTTGSRDTTSSGGFSIGRFNWTTSTFNWVGQIDDVRVYNYALSATQVKLLYNENSAVHF